MKRTFDPSILQSRRALLEGAVVGFDSEAITSNTENYVLTDGRDVILFEKTRDNCYTGHLFLERGDRAGFEFSRDCLEYIFNEGASIILGLTPVSNKKALWFSARIGMKEVGIIDTPLGDMVLKMITSKDMKL